MVAVCVGVTVFVAVEVMVGGMVSVGTGGEVLVGVMVLEGGMITVVDVFEVRVAAEQPAISMIPMPKIKLTVRVSTLLSIIQPVGTLLLLV